MNNESTIPLYVCSYDFLKKYVYTYLLYQLIHYHTRWIKVWPRFIKYMPGQSLILVHRN